MTRPTKAGEEEAASSLFASARLFILLQLGSRLCTFALNQFLVRLTSPEVFGAATIQFELLLGLVLTAAREGVRCVTLRDAKSESAQKEHKARELSDEEQAAHNLSFLSVAAGLVIDIVLSYAYIKRASSSLRSSPFFVPSVFLFALGGALELVSEPLFNRAQVEGNVGLRVRAEGLAVLTNCLTVLACIVKPEVFGVRRDLGGSYGLMAYGWGRLVFGATLLGTYLVAFVRRKGTSGTLALLCPRRVTSKGSSSYFSSTGISLAWAMGKQAMLKHVMGESDKFAVARLGTLEDQGGYALASNYGSLVLRILFNPIEEATRIALSRRLGHVFSGQDSKADKASLEAAADMLSAILRLHTLLGLFFATFGPPLAFSAIYVLAGPRWACTTSASTILGAYACYIPVLGFNGIGEAFLTATAGPKQLATHNKIIISSSAVFIGSLWAFQQLPFEALKETGLVWSSILAVGLRAAYAWWYSMWFLRYAEGKPQTGAYAAKVSPSNVMPSILVLASFVGSAVALHVVPEKFFTRGQTCPNSIREIIPPVAIGGMFTLACVIACAIFEGRRIMQSVASVRGKDKAE